MCHTSGERQGCGEMARGWQGGADGSSQDCGRVFHLRSRGFAPQWSLGTRLWMQPVMDAYVLF